MPGQHDGTHDLVVFPSQHTAPCVGLSCRGAIRVLEDEVADRLKLVRWHSAAAGGEEGQERRLTAGFDWCRQGTSVVRSAAAVIRPGDELDSSTAAPKSPSRENFLLLSPLTQYTCSST